MGMKNTDGKNGGEPFSDRAGTFIRHLSSSEYVAVLSMIVASVYLMLTSFFPILYNLTSSFDPIDFLKNVFYFIIGMGTLAGVSFLLRKETYLQHIADETFENVIYHRLEPVLRDVAEVQVDLTNVQNQLDMMNKNIQHLSKKEASPVSQVSLNTSYHVKYIVLINLTLAVFIFMLQRPLGYVPYAITVLYIIWWLVITGEYKLWNIDVVWTWVFVPVLVLPVYTIAMNSYLPDYILFSSLFIGLGIYSFSYYSWCSYMIRGVMPFNLQDVLDSAQEKISIAKEHPARLVQNPDLAFNLKMPSRNQAGRNMILLAIALFCVTWFGYAIQHNMIPNVSWEAIGLKNFVWSASHTYVLNLVGLILILLGLKFLKRTET
ncbi:MAG TPA: hypothetical protein VJJ51_00295 [Candidatus Methanoperedens sp.]|nr:hypothetical protein [Candidatus Methanoperedens sp.]